MVSFKRIGGQFFRTDRTVQANLAEYELDILNTTFSKEIYMNFKKKCKEKGFFVKNVLMAFMETYLSSNFVLEFIEEEKTK